MLIYTLVSQPKSHPAMLTPASCTLLVGVLPPPLVTVMVSMVVAGGATVVEGAPGRHWA